MAENEELAGTPVPHHPSGVFAGQVRATATADWSRDIVGRPEGLNVFTGGVDARQSDRIDAPVSRFRPTYRALTAEEKARHDAIKVAAEQLEQLIGETPAGRYQALAMTALEESVMWAVKGLTS